MKVHKVSTKVWLKNLIASTNYWWLLFGVIVITRIPTLFFPYDSDHWIFYYVGRKWFDGSILYLEVWDHKSPLIFAINGLMAKVLGDSLIIHRIFLSLIFGLTVWLFYRTALRLFEVLKRPSALDARIATLFFGFWASLSQFTNSGNNTENFGILALLIALYCYLRYIQDKHWKWLLYSGVGVSAVVFLKINFVLLILPLVIDFIIRNKNKPIRIVSQGLIWSAATITQAILWFSYFAPKQLMDEWWIAMVSFNSKYLKAGWAGNLSGQMIFIAVLVIASIFFLGGIYGVWKNRKIKNDRLIFYIAIFTIFFSLILGTFYNHYYLIVIPYMCLISAAYYRVWLNKKPLIFIAIVSIVASMLISYKQLYNSLAGSATNDFNQMSSAALAVKEITEQEDKIFFYGYGATFYRLADRDSGSRYISASHLLIDEREGFGYDFTGKFIGDMQVSQAKYIIIDPNTKDLYSENQRAMDYINKHYQLEMTIGGYELLRRVM